MKKMTNNLRLDDLNLDGLKLYQYVDGYAFTSDSVILSNFIKATHKDTCVEIGSGSGVISVLVNYKCKPQKIVCFEMQEKYANLTKLNFEFNKMNNVEIICDKIQNYKNHITKPVSVVYSNPPYYKNDVCKKSEKEEIAIAKHEQYLTLEELICCASKMLKFGGKFYFVYPAQRLDEIFVLLDKYNLTPKRMFFAQPTINKNANTVYLECHKGGKCGVKILPTLVTNNLDGDYVTTIQKLYRDS